VTNSILDTQVARLGWSVNLGAAGSGTSVAPCHPLTDSGNEHARARVCSIAFKAAVRQALPALQDLERDSVAGQGFVAYAGADSIGIINFNWQNSGGFAKWACGSNSVMT
jgi:hypothetical protein